MYKSMFIRCLLVLAYFGFSTISFTEVMAQVDPPPVPKNLSATSGDGHVSLSWSASQGASFYNYRVGSGSARNVGYSTSGRENGLTNGTSYTFQVRSGRRVQGITAHSAWSDAVSATPNIAAPTGLTATPGDGKVGLSWTAPSVDTITGYEYQKDSDSWASAGTASSYDVTGLTNGTQYSFKIRAKGAGGSGTASTSISATPNIAAPTGVTATAGDSKVTLSWTAPSVDTITGYQYQKDSDTWAPAGTASTYDVTGLTNGIQYSFKIRAKGAGGSGQASGPVTATPAQPQPTPPQPTPPQPTPPQPTPPQPTPPQPTPPQPTPPQQPNPPPQQPNPGIPNAPIGQPTPPQNDNSQSLTTSGDSSALSWLSSPKQISFSELMFTSRGGPDALPQWIELYNNSKTQSVNLKGWRLEIEACDKAGNHQHNVIVLGDLTIPAGQAALIVTAIRSETVGLPRSQVYDFFNYHRYTFKHSGENTVLGRIGFFLRLSDPNGSVSDVVGNLDGNIQTFDEPLWVLPSVKIDDGSRTSLMRRYEPLSGKPLDGTQAFNWQRAVEAELQRVSYWGKETDIGNPGYTAHGTIEFRPPLISISEVMLNSRGGLRSLPQWVELKNVSATETVNLQDWSLRIESRDTKGVNRFGVVTFKELLIPPSEVALLVTSSGRHSRSILPEDRIYTISTADAFGDTDYRAANQVFGPVGFFFKFV